MALNLKSIISQVTTWFDTTEKTRLEASPRKYLNYELKESPTFKSLADLFDRTELNGQFFEELSGEKGPKKERLATAVDIDTVFGIHKCMALRYRTRLQSVRDDMSQKGARVRASLYQASEKMEAWREMLKDEG